MKDSLRNALNAIPRKLQVNEGDYEVEGILHCGRCRTPKQVRISIGDGEYIKPLCVCKCMKEQIEAEERERQRKLYEERIKEARAKCFPESELQNWNFYHDDSQGTKISAVAKNYVANFDEMRKRGKGLLLFGTVGTGKTFYAACIANALIDKGYKCLMTNFARLVNTISGMYAGKQDYIDSLNTFDLLVLDDFAAERDTEYMNEIVHTIIDSRYRAGLPTIITTNLTNKELTNPAEIHRQRTYSRLLEMTIPVKVDGVDRRKEKLKTDFKDLNNLLGL